MSDRFGPWASSIQVGSNPQLSAFWKKRMTMLEHVGKTSPMLSQQNLLWLGILGMAMLVLPTFRSMHAIADEETPAKEQAGSIATAPASATHSTSTTSPQKETFCSGGTAATIQEAGPDYDESLAFSFYSPLRYERIRKELGLSGQQESQLREIQKNAMAEHKRRWPEYRKKLDEMAKANIPIQEQAAMHTEWESEVTKPYRKQVDEVLTAEQLAALKQIMLCDNTTGAWFFGGKWRELVGMSPEQRKAYNNEQLRLWGEHHRKMLELKQENDEQLLAVLSPQQRQQLEEQIGPSDSEQSAIFGESLFTSYLSSKPGHIDYPVLCESVVLKGLDLSDDQVKKLRTIVEESQPSQELYKLHQPKSAAWGASASCTSTIGGGKEAAKPLGWIQAKQPELQQKSEELERQLREQLREVLTPQQSAAFKKLSLQRAIAYSLRNDSKTLEALNATEQQKEKILQLREARTWFQQELDRKQGSKLLKLLTPQQQAKLMEALDRREWTML